MKMFSRIMLVFLFLPVQGCSVFTNPKEKPVIEDALGARTGTLATTPERRIVIFDRSTGNFCAEPPADVADNLVSSFASALEGTNGTVTAKAEIAKTFASTAKQLFLRSQGVQLYRDGMYSLCQSFINKAVTPGEFRAIQKELLTESSKLIATEIQYLQYLKPDGISAPSAQAAPDLNNK